MMEENEYITLILKHLDGETDEMEEAGLQQWLDADPDHRREYRELERIWEDSGRLRNSRSFDKATAWKKIEAKVSPGDAAYGGHGKPFPWKRVLAAACVLGVLLSAGWWFGARKSGRSLQVIPALDAVRQLSLPDGSVVELLKGATLRYKEPFDDTVREVYLSGEAFFQPAHDPSRPFRITTAHSIVEDMGTSFLLNNESDLDEVVVVTGKVKLVDRKDPSHSIELLPRRRGTLQEGRLVQHEAASSNIMSWKTGVLDFRKEPLGEVVDDIGNFYHIRIFLTRDLWNGRDTITVNARFDHQPLGQVVDELRLVTGLSIENKSDSLFFSRR
jgi:transmembrane sensor